MKPPLAATHVRFGTPGLARGCRVRQRAEAVPGTTPGPRAVAAEAPRLARPFRRFAPSLAALGLAALRRASLAIGSAAASPSGIAEDGRVVFRHYL